MMYADPPNVLPAQTAQPRDPPSSPMGSIWIFKVLGKSNDEQELAAKSRDFAADLRSDPPARRGRGEGDAGREAGRRPEPYAANEDSPSSKRVRERRVNACSKRADRGLEGERGAQQGQVNDGRSRVREVRGCPEMKTRKSPVSRLVVGARLGSVSTPGARCH